MLEKIISYENSPVITVASMILNNEDGNKIVPSSPTSKIDTEIPRGDLKDREEGSLVTSLLLPNGRQRDKRIIPG